MVPIILKNDQILGKFACVEENEAKGLREYLVESRISFALDAERAARLAEPGKRTFVFGASHPHQLRELLAGYGPPVEVAEGMTFSENSYRPPVDQLLQLGESWERNPKHDCAALGISREHVSELIRMATDEELHTGPYGSPIVWAPVRACWLLAELRAEEAIAPLLDLLRRVDEEGDDWVGEQLPCVLAEFGAAAIAPLAEYLGSPGHGEWACVAAAKALAKVGTMHPESRDDCVVRLSAQLRRFREQSEGLNSFLVMHLVELRVVEAAPLIEEVFTSGRVDEMVNGDWEDAQIALGMKRDREQPRKPNILTMLSDRLRGSLAQASEPPPLGNVPDRIQPFSAPQKVGRNDPCPCGSGKKFKKCCLR